jgi:hypothetical protein
LGPAWQHEAQASERAGDHRRAAAQAFLGHLLLSPFHPRKAVLLDSLRRNQIADRKRRPGQTFEQVRLAGGKLAGYLEKPRAEAIAAPSPRPLVLLLPPLASTKEELTVLADPLLAAGFPVLRLDLPGQGESPPPLTIQSERLLAGGTRRTGCGAGNRRTGGEAASRAASVWGRTLRCGWPVRIRVASGVRLACRHPRS